MGVGGDGLDQEIEVKIVRRIDKRYIYILKVEPTGFDYGLHNKV